VFRFSSPVKAVASAFFTGIVFLFTPLSASVDENPRIYYFYSDECPECRQIREHVLPDLIESYRGRVSFELLELKGEGNLRMLLDLEKKTGRKIRKRPPLVIAGTVSLEGADEVTKGLGPLAERLSGGKTLSAPAAPEPSEASGDEVVRSFRSLGVFQIVLGGLLDGINPCAFTTVIFLLSYLALIGKKGRTLVSAGAAFTAGVFVSYFLIGVGLLEIVMRLSCFPAVSRIVAISIGVAALVLSALSVYDCVKIGKGKTKEVLLQLGGSMKKRIHCAIRENARSGMTFIASAVLGVFIGMLEFPCTGQVYFPIVVVIREMSAMRAQGIAYLLLYNVMFILPLIAVFVLAYRGISSEKMAGWVKKHLFSVKLLIAFFFAVTGCFLIVMNIR
jgi:cytochrome c biogenesis protein CcdA